MYKAPKQVLKFVDHLVRCCAKWCRNANSYILIVEDIAEHDLAHLAALIMANDFSYSNEATGADNDDYEKSMLPTLVSYLKDTTSEDAGKDFLKKWEKGCVNYFRRCMNELFMYALDEFNQNCMDDAAA
jgi:hypothetical protein